MIFGWKNNRKSTSRTQDSAENSVEPIDYERLAKCIAKAIAEENDRRATAYSVTREWMKFVISPIFVLIIVLSAILSIVFFLATFNILITIDGATVLQRMISFILSLTFLSIAIMAFFANKEFDKEKDKQFVASVFSGMISLVALIVALVAFFMEVEW